MAEIHIGNLHAGSSKTNKKQAKLFAAKNLLKTIDSNTYLREKFFYYLKEEKEVDSYPNKQTFGMERPAVNHISDSHHLQSTPMEALNYNMPVQTESFNHPLRPDRPPVIDPFEVNKDNN